MVRDHYGKPVNPQTFRECLLRKPNKMRVVWISIEFAIEDTIVSVYGDDKIVEDGWYIASVNAMPDIQAEGRVRK